MNLPADFSRQGIRLSCTSVQWIQEVTAGTSRLQLHPGEFTSRKIKIFCVTKTCDIENVLPAYGGVLYRKVDSNLRPFHFWVAWWPHG